MILQYRRAISAAALFLVALTLQRAATAAWGEAVAPEGGVYRISPVGVSHARFPHDPTAETVDCRWWPRAGSEPLCAAAPGIGAEHERLRLAYPALQVALWLSVAALFLQVLQVPRQRWMHAVLAALLLSCIVAAIDTMLTVPERVLAVLQGRDTSWTALGAVLGAGAALLSLLTLLMYPGGTRRSGDAGSRAALLLLGAAGALGAQSPRAPSNVPPLPRDSVRIDAEAFAALPARLRSVLDVRRRIAVESADPNLSCVPLSGTSDGSRRQRLQGKLGDGTSLVVFARYTPGGTLRRVEFVRRLVTGEQRGFTWDAEGDTTVASDWRAGETLATSYPIPRGGPVPRAVRALGRLVTQWRCPAG